MTIHPLLLDQFWGDDPVSRFFAYYWLPILGIVIVVIIASRFSKKR